MKTPEEYEKELAAAKAKVDEFRTNNIALLKRNDELKALAGDKESLDKYIQGQVDAAVKPLADELESIKQEREGLQQELRAKAVDDQVIAVAAKAGADPECLPHIALRARKVFRDTGNGVTPDASGSLVYGESGDKPITIQEWLQTGIPRAWWKPSHGGGADGKSGRGGSPNTLASPNTETFSQNLEAIASGKIQVKR